MKPTLSLLSALLLTPLTQVAAEELPDGVRRVGPSELRIEREYIGAPGLARPVPQGLVDVNPPWLHVQVPFPPGKHAARAQQWKLRFYFKLSQDPDLKRDVIESGPKRWSFFSPYRALATGTWYWTYGVAAAESPDKPVWQKEVFSFVVDDRAFAPAIPPTPEQVLAALRKRQSGPVAICTSEDIGHILPERTWPELAARLRQDAEKALRDGERPVSIELTQKDIPERLGPNPKESFFMVKLRALFTAEERRVDALLRGYLLTGDERFKRLGLQRASELEHERLNRTFDTPAGKIPLTRPTFYNTVPMLMLDAFWDDLPEAQRQAFTALALSLMDKRGNGFPHLHDQLEHAHFNQHDWQGDIKNLLLGPAILSRHRADLNDWFSYAYNGMFPKYGVTQSDDPLPPGLIVLGVPVTRENGFGKPGVTRFRRHLVMLRPSHLLLYDELEAEKPVTWTFLLHSLKPMRQPGNAWFTTANSAGAGSARLFCAAPVAGSVTDQFFAAAVDEENKRGGENPPHWHVAIATREKLRATRFLTVIEVQPIAVNLTEPTAVGEGNVKLQVGDYTIAAELDASRPSLLEIRNREETCALVTGQAADGISLGADRRRAAAKGSTLLWEREPGKPALFREEVDQLPPVLLYGNRY